MASSLSPAQLEFARRHGITRWPSPPVMVMTFNLRGTEGDLIRAMCRPNIALRLPSHTGPPKKVRCLLEIILEWAASVAVG